MTVHNALMIVAILVAPFLAVFAQRQIDLWRERRQRKLWVFKTLMATRGRTLSPEHVQALNMIELEFQKPSEKPILLAWKEYHDHLNSYPREGENQKERAAVWTQRTDQLLATLLIAMGKTCGYEFDTVQIRKGVYSPQGHATAEFELQVVRRLVMEWLAGNRSVSVLMVPKDEEAAKQGQSLMEGISGIIDGQKRIKIELVTREDVNNTPRHSLGKDDS
ncbi:MAG TPA: DUF6680 family protein [Phycisphaerae bacterium]|nr:DUF6680 family protein [Phycisphaerae bacterium]